MSTLSDFNARFATFSSFPVSDFSCYWFINPWSLAKAGFFYSGSDDICQCFCCGGLLYRWRADDDPWVEHANFYPSCTFLQEKKGRIYIDQVLAYGAPF